MLSVSLREPEVLRRLREETAELAQANMQISPEQGQFMAFLVELMSIDKALEVGVFTGYSALCVALALPPGGRLVACDVNGLSVSQYWDDENGEAMASDVVDLMVADDPPELVEKDEEWPDPFVGEVGPVHWGSGLLGGATASFQGTGDDVCLIVDPQTIWRDDWAMGADGHVDDSSTDNYLHDDGDIDLTAGLSADYTGTPGQVMGSFQRTFVDPNGVERSADFNICLMYDRYGLSGASSGRATPEWCTIKTEEGVSYTVALTTYSVPYDDDRLRFAFQMRAAECPLTVHECTLRGDADPIPVEVVVDDNTYDYDDMEERYCEPRHL